MNPETKLTKDELVAICTRHNIKYISHKRITTGFNHEVHRLNDDLVIKLFNKRTDKAFLCESRILGVDSQKIRKPELVATYSTSGGPDRSYIIMSYISGYTPTRTWHLRSETERKRLISQISNTLKGFQDLDTNIFDFQKSFRWRQYLENKVADLISRLSEKDTLNQTVVDRIRNITPKLLVSFEANEVLRPVYWDIHFDNFIVDDAFNLQAIIDLENVRQLPLDYPLFVIKKQMETPEMYLSEQYEQFANTKDYEHLWQWYEQFYPDMFAYKNLKERVVAYQLLDALHLLINWSDVIALHTKLDSLLASIESRM